MTTVNDLQQLNVEVNQIPYVAGMGPTEPVDFWTWQPTSGTSWVCRDYVQRKAELLREAGFPPTDLMTVLCWTEPVMPATDESDPNSGREYHAVLRVVLENENWILDSRFSAIYLWSQPPVDYRWDRVQVAGSTEFESVNNDMLA